MNEAASLESVHLLNNGTIHSTAEPYAEAMLVEKGHVAWLGSDETASRLKEQYPEGVVQEQDLDRTLVAPGFVGWITRGVAEGTQVIWPSVSTPQQLWATRPSEWGWPSRRSCSQVSRCRASSRD
ncbi:hypothetical protein [Nesterenkonia pannonica]|uniref:hypothetical protein n=1 Tax=Nesterenkonia pannonica TaxID=1548602 RepID=UPI002164474C|nr:hypothetical protein [Nesterenkonia pannonica]